MTKRLRAALAAAGLLRALAGAPAGAEPAVVRRGDLRAQIRLTGTIEPVDVFRLKSTIEGRVEAVAASTNSWSDRGRPLGVLADKELAAILDARGNTGNAVLEERWQKIYKPAKILCPDLCFVLKSFIKPKQLVRPQAVLIEACKSLRLIGRVRPEEARWVSAGQAFSFWPVDDPSKKMTARIGRYEADPDGKRGEAGGFFSLDMNPQFYLNPGTKWEGLILSDIKKKALLVPTKALIRRDGEAYLPVRVSEGFSTDENTEIVDGVEEGRQIFVPDGPQ